MNRKLLVPVNGKRIRELRQAKGWSAYRLGEKTGLSPSGIWDLERGRNKRTWHLEKIAHALGVDAIEIKRSFSDLPSPNDLRFEHTPGKEFVLFLTRADGQKEEIRGQTCLVTVIINIQK